jgi:hypothetical protein
VIPAIPLIVLRPFLPESPMWNAGGRSHRVPIRVLFSGHLARTTIVAMVATAASYALAYGAMQHLPRIVAGLPELAGLSAVARDAIAGQVQVVQETGGLAGRAALVVFVVTAIARRRLLQRMQWAALIAFPITFAWLSGLPLTWLEVGVFMTAAITAAQLSFWGNYLPRVFPTNVRATGESVAVNIGGRILGTSAVLATGALSVQFTPAYGASRGLALAAACVAGVACVVGLVASRFLAEPTSDQLPT